jgi:hypothetical protein
MTDPYVNTDTGLVNSGLSIPNVSVPVLIKPASLISAEAGLRVTCPSARSALSSMEWLAR